MQLQGSDFVGQLTVNGDTSYYIELVSVDGEAYRGSNEYDVSVLSDQPPVISFDKPGRDEATNLEEEVFTGARRRRLRRRLDGPALLRQRRR